MTKRCVGMCGLDNIWIDKDNQRQGSEINNVVVLRRKEMHVWLADGRYVKSQYNFAYVFEPEAKLSFRNNNKNQKLPCHYCASLLVCV